MALSIQLIHLKIFDYHDHNIRHLFFYGRIELGLFKIWIDKARLLGRVIIYISE